MRELGRAVVAGFIIGIAAFAMFAATVSLLTLFSGPAMPQERAPACGTRASIVAALGRQYGESLTAQGITAGGWLLEVLAAPGAGWTLIITKPDGTACVSASGEAWWQSCGKETPA